MRSRRILIGSVIAAIALVVVGGAWAYDHGRRDTIASGVRVGGIDVGGMGAGAARAKVERALLARLRRPVVATYEGRRVVLSVQRAGVAVNVDGAVDQALTRSRSGSFFARVGREIGGGAVHADVQPRIVYSALADMATRNITRSSGPWSALRSLPMPMSQVGFVFSECPR